MKKMNSLLDYVISFLFDKNETDDGQAYSFLPLISAGLPVVLIDGIYALFVLKIGPKLMETRKPYDLKNVLKWYNTLQIVSNLLLSILAIYNILVEEDVELACMLKVPVGHHRKSAEVYLFYWGYLNKFLDYFDTIIFVLRKSYRQVNFLHVYHHLMMTTCAYMYIRYYGFGGHGAVVGVLNCIVHTFMYSYYLMAAKRPSLKQSVWWKSYITKLQLVQFCLMFAHQVWPLIFRPDCRMPKIWCLLAMCQSGLMLIMFGNFYRRTYSKAVKESPIDFIGMCNRNLSEELRENQKKVE